MSGSAEKVPLNRLGTTFSVDVSWMPALNGGEIVNVNSVAAWCSMRFRRIPDETVRRMPIYLRGAVHLLRKGVQSTSSRELTSLVGVSPWKVRKDFSYFGGDFGTPGVGYEISHLVKHINRILKLDTVHKAALVGVGKLGVALLRYSGFKTYGFEISAAFDIDKKKVGRTVGRVVVEDVSRLPTLRNRGISLAIIAVPGEPAQRIADELFNAGVRGILNFSPCYISAPKKVKIITIDIAMDLVRLPYYLPSTGRASDGNR